MKKLLITFCILIMTVLLFPIRGQIKDGGSVEYRAILYCVTDVHRISSMEDYENGKHYDEGWIIEILGFEIFNNVE